MQIIATNYLSEKEIEKYASGRRGFILFGAGDNTDLFFRNLELHGFERIDLRDIVIKCRSSLRQAVIEFSGALNRSVPSHNWWAVGFSRRIAMYPCSSGLAKLFIMRTIIDMGRWDTCLIYDDSISPWDYIEDGAHQIKVKFHTKFPATADWKYRVKKILPVSTVPWVFRKIITKTKLGWEPLKIKENNSGNHATLFTLIDKNNFTKEGSFRDLYLGELANHLKKEGRKVFILGQLHDRLSKNLFSNIDNMCDYPIALLDQFWSVSDLFAVVKEVLRDFFNQPPEWAPSHFAGFDIRGFLNANLQWDLQAGYPDSLLDYKAAKICLQQILPDLFIYPYENKCMERMLLKAISEICPDTKTIGYQHAVLTPKHIHMFLADGESQALPLPDKIVTNGPHTAHMLYTEGNYPEGMIVAGTALRQTTLIPDIMIKGYPPGQITKILMTLAEGKEEYDKAFDFLREIQGINNTDRFDFRVRLHPGIPYDPFQNKKLVRGIKCTKDAIPSLLESLYWADVVLYASTSVAVQAMAMGIPAIWMDLLDFWGNDPINKDDVLKWELTSSNKWCEVISAIEQLHQDEFNQKMENSKKFISDYFSQKPLNIKEWLYA